MEMNGDILLPTCLSPNLWSLRMHPFPPLSKKKSLPRLPAPPQTQSGCPGADH